MDHLLDYVAHAVIWRAVSAWFRDLPPAVQLVAAAAACVAVVVLRSRRRARAR